MQRPPIFAAWAAIFIAAAILGGVKAAHAHRHQDGANSGPSLAQAAL